MLVSTWLEVAHKANSEQSVHSTEATKECVPTELHVKQVQLPMVELLPTAREVTSSLCFNAVISFASPKFEEFSSVTCNSRIFE